MVSLPSSIVGSRKSLVKVANVTNNLNTLLSYPQPLVSSFNLSVTSDTLSGMGNNNSGPYIPDELLFHSPLDSVVSPRDDLTDISLQESDAIASEFFTRHRIRDPDLFHCVIMPSTLCFSGDVPLRRFNVWVKVMGNQHPFSSRFPVQPLNRVKVHKCEVGPEGVTPKPTPSALREYLNTPIPDLLIEEKAVSAARFLANRIIDRSNKLSDSNRRIRRSLDTRARESGVFGDPAASSVRRVLLAYVRLAYLRDITAEEDAHEWARGYEYPADVMSRDLDTLLTVHLQTRLKGQPLVAMAEIERLRRQPHRLNPERVKSLVEAIRPDDLPRSRKWFLTEHNPKDLDRIKSFSTHGVPIVRGLDVSGLPDTRITGWKHRPPLRKKYLTMKDVVNKNMIESWWKSGLAWIFPVDKLQDPDCFGIQVLEGLQTSVLHHVIQPGVGKPEGRTICDPSNNRSGPNLNGEATKAECRDWFGELNLPSLVDICIMIEKYRIMVGSKAEPRMILAKGDMKGAFTLLDIKPSDIPLNAYEMSIDLAGVTVPALLILTSGYFGWTGFPFAFAVVSRILQFLVARVIYGLLLVYVDDFILVTLAEHLDADLHVMSVEVENLMGPKSMAPNKFVAGRSLEILGWTVDLDTNRVTPSDKNFLKAFYWFWTVSQKQSGVTLAECDKVCAYASRFAVVCPVLTPFLGPLYRQQTLFRWSHAHVSHTPSDEFTRALSVWCLALVLFHFDGEDPLYAASISSLAVGKQYSPHVFESSADGTNIDLSPWSVSYVESWERGPAPPLRILLIIVQVDGSLTGVGFVIWEGPWNGVRGNRVLFYGECTFNDLIPTLGNLPTSNYQNSSELFAAVFGFVTLKLVFPEWLNRVHFVSDSMSTLSWISKRRWTGRDETLRASLAFMMLTLRGNLTLQELSHVKGVDNVLPDLLSRGSIPTELLGCPHLTSHDHPGLTDLLVLLHPRAHEVKPRLNTYHIMDDVESAICTVFPNFANRSTCI